MRGEGSIHQRKNGTWSGQIDLGYGPNGRRRRTVYGPTQNAVVRKMAQLRRQLDTTGDLPTADPTLATWLVLWLTEHAAKRVKPSTLRGYRTAVHQHLIPTIGKARLSKLSPQHVRDMHKTLAARGLSTTTALNAHRVLSAALSDAVTDGKVGRNVATITRAPSKAASTRTALTADEAVKVLLAAKDDRLGARWLVAFMLGVRQGERLGMRWSAIDQETRTVDIEWSLQAVTFEHGCDGKCGRKRGGSCPQRRLAIPDGMDYVVLKPDDSLVLLRPKTKGSVRRLPLVEPLWAALQARRDAVLTERAGYTADYDLIWCTETGEPIEPHDDWQDWHDLLATARVRTVTQHEARHSTATLLLELGVDAETIRQILGHSDVLTSRGYQHVSTELARAALDRLSDRLVLPG